MFRQLGDSGQAEGARGQERGGWFVLRCDHENQSNASLVSRSR